MKIAYWGLGILLVMPLSGWAGQQQSTQQAPADPVAEAARRAREQKKDEAKTPHVWNNDDIPKTNGVSVVGETPAAGADASAGDAANGANPPAAAAVAPNGDSAAAPGQPAASEKTGAIAAELVTAKEQLKSLQTDLDIAQRKYALDQQTYLSNPQHQDDVAGASQLKDEEDQIAAKQQEITDAQKKVDEIQARLAASAPAVPAPPTNRD
jgi:type I restriction-modification system DNA methylase subunit